MRSLQIVIVTVGILALAAVSDAGATAFSEGFDGYSYGRHNYGGHGFGGHNYGSHRYGYGYLHSRYRGCDRNPGYRVPVTRRDGFLRQDFSGNLRNWGLPFGINQRGEFLPGQDGNNNLQQRQQQRLDENRGVAPGNPGNQNIPQNPGRKLAPQNPPQPQSSEQNRRVAPNAPGNSGNQNVPQNPGRKLATPKLPPVPDSSSLQKTEVSRKTEKPIPQLVEIPNNMKGIALLPKAEQAAALAQRTCPITGDLLGADGKPLTVNVNGRTVFVCCEGCIEKLQANPEKFLK